MTFTANGAAQAAITVVRTYSIEADKVASVKEATGFSVHFECSGNPPQQGLDDVSGWTYCALYEEGTNQPYATMISQGPDPARLVEWAAKLHSAQVNVWINSAKATSAGVLAAIALHEFELHVLAFYEFFNRLSTLAYHADLHNSTQAADTLRDLVGDVNAGTYRASTQHASTVLRANQALSAFALAAEQVAGRMTDVGAKPEIDPDSYEYAAIMTTRNDITESFEDLAPVKAAYGGRLGPLETVCGKEVVDFVVSEFETE
ncbi:hypothetical protein HS041_29435 [Planomonospora sp. ID67723]|uniref:hypothetical protein n=1 Tax=Planomonospora sp. ID67723 TaxID=2738134 RepID=UPI0018C3A606|nr:hypothetical protein [Planomonospora sp. ID67723]MBG0831844.1 hypothetical protein [Planomonospora sp. ID67723]